MHVIPSNAHQTTTTETAAVGEGPAPVAGLPAQLTLAAFLVVMLVVPALMARAPVHRGEAEPSPREGSRSRGFRFRSDRERRLWLWTVAALVAIYSTLGPVAELAAALRARNLLRLSMAIVLVVVVLAFAVPCARRRPGRLEVGAAIGIAAVYLTTLIRIPVPEARSHLFEYGLVAMLIFHALTERNRNGGRVPLPAMAAIAATAVLGWLDEGIQALLPNRTYDLVDVGFNLVAATMAIAATLLMTWARKVRPFRGGAPPTS